MITIQLSKYRTEKGVESLINEYNRLREEVNSQSAFTKKECEQRLKLLQEYESIENTLRVYFSLQSFEYRGSIQEIGIEII